MCEKRFDQEMNFDQEKNFNQEKKFGCPRSPGNIGDLGRRRI